MIAAEIVEGMGDAAFAARPQEGIIAWNEAAQRLLGHRSCHVLGRPCFEVLAGRDVFGNKYCGKNCALVRMARKREAIARFDIRYRHRSGRVVPVGVSMVVVPNGSRSKVDLIHVLESRRVETAWDRRGSDRDSALRDHDQRGHGSPPSRDASTMRLTPREIEVLRLMGEGLGTRAIAGQLGITVATTRNHIQNILTRLEVHSRLEAVSVARRCNLI